MTPETIETMDKQNQCTLTERKLRFVQQTLDELVSKVISCRRFMVEGSKGVADIDFCMFKVAEDIDSMLPVLHAISKDLTFAMENLRDDREHREHDD